MCVFEVKPDLFLLKPNICIKAKVLPGFFLGNQFFVFKSEDKNNHFSLRIKAITNLIYCQGNRFQTSISKPIIRVSAKMQIRAVNPAFIKPDFSIFA